MSNETPAERPPEVTDRLRKVLSLRMDGGTTKLNTAKNSQRQMQQSVLAAIYAILRRPIDVDDVNPAIAEMLIRQWQREGLLVKSLRLRIEWFSRTNEVANSLGIQERFDFSEINVLRGFDWQKDRRAVPLPDDPQPLDQDGKSHSQMTLLVLLDEHYRPARLVGKSANTLRLYQHSINVFSKYLGRPAIVADLTTRSVSDFLDFLLNETKLSRHTIQKDRTQLCVLWNYVARKGWVTEFPQIPSINAPDRVPDSWSDAELFALWTACKKQTGLIGRVSASDFWLACISVVNDTAERIGAIIQTSANDLNTFGVLTVRGQHRKGGRRDKQYRLHPLTVDRLTAIQQPGQKMLIPWPYSEGYLWKKYGDLLESAGLPAGRRDKFHKLRRTTASKFMSAGGNPTELLDHATSKTTRKSYIDPSIVSTLQPADVLPAFGESATPAATPAPVADANAELLEKFRSFLASQS